MNKSLFLRVLVIVMFFVLGLASFPAYGAAPGGPTNLRVNDVVGPAGTGATVYFGWYVNDEDADEIQSAYQIQVSSSKELLDADNGDTWDSGKVSDRLQNHVGYGGKNLESDSCYYWKVRTWDRVGEQGEWSQAGSFTVGLNGKDDWSDAFWIKRATNEPDDYSYYRKQVEIAGKGIDRATVYISSVHKYALYLNGELVGKGPAYNFPQYQYYNAFDVTSMVKAGESNQFAIFNHWFGGGQGRPKSDRGVIMKMIVHFADGTSAVVCTDGSWRQSRAAAWEPGQAHRNRGEGVGYVEKIDAGKLEPGWNEIDYDDSEWESVTVIGAHPVKPWTGEMIADLTRIAEYEISPASISSVEDGVYVVDLGKVYAGVPVIEFSGGKAGETVEMLAGYALDALGRVDPKKNQSTNMSFYAVLNGGDFVYEPVEYLGMRYYEIKNPPMSVTNSNFKFVVRHSEMDCGQSYFESSDETLNAVWDLMKHSLLTCGQEEFVDTPTREKGGFLGDAAIQSIVAMPVMNERVLTQRALNEFLQSMDHYWSDQSLRGGMNAVYPNRDGRRDIPDFTQAYLVWVLFYYLETGDRAFLTENYAKLKDIADYVYKYRDEESGLITNLEGGSGAYKYGIIDWPASMRFGYEMTDARTVINSWAYIDFSIVSLIAYELGNDADRELYHQRAKDLQEAMNSQLVNEDGFYIDGINQDGSRSSHVSQHANMFPLALNMVPNEYEQVVLSKVKDLEISVGMVTMPWLIRAIGEAEEGDHLVEMFTNKDWPGWARCLKRGATSTWESWFSDTAGESMSHAWGASGLEGYIRYILGIRAGKPQYELVDIRPLDFGNRLSWSKGAIATDRGQVAVSWKNDAGVYSMQVEIPVNMTCNAFLPAGDEIDPVVYVDGEEVEAIDFNGKLLIKGLGSGKHTLVRKEK